MTPLALGDLTVFAPAQEVPPKLLKALAVIARDLHPHLQISGLMSHGQCVLCALTVRDYLQDIGFTSARAASVAFAIHAERGGKVLHQLAVGTGRGWHPDDKLTRWDGHLVTVVDDWLIDTTLYQAQRPQWPMLTGMAAIRMNPGASPRKPKRPLAGFSCHEGDTLVTAAWLAQPGNGKWVGSPDTINQRRAPTVARMTSNFGPWFG